MFKEISVDELKSQLDAGEVFLLDVRNPDETAQGIIPGAKLLPLHLLPIHKDVIPTDKPVMISCRSGARSGQACMFLAESGIDATNVQGGIMAWAASGNTICAPDESCNLV